VLTKEEVKRFFPEPCRVIHKLCGGILFWTNGYPRSNQPFVLNPDKCLLPNGATPTVGPIICQTCQYDVLENGLEWVKE
jgi:hypothetical protein